MTIQDVKVEFSLKECKSNILLKSMSRDIWWWWWVIRVFTNKTLLKWNQRHLVQSTEHRVQSTEYGWQIKDCRVQSTKCRVQSAEYKAQSTEHRAIVLLVILFVDKLQNMQQGIFDNLGLKEHVGTIHYNEKKKNQAGPPWSQTLGWVGWVTILGMVSDQPWNGWPSRGWWVKY